MIDKTRSRVKELYPGSEVIYGDTDSVMVKFKLERSVNLEKSDKILESMDFGKEAAAKITEDF